MKNWKKFVCTPMAVGLLSCALLPPSWADNQEAISGENVVVTATRNAMDSRDAPGAITVISREEINQSSAGDLEELIREQSGVLVSGTGLGGRKTVTFRGLESRHTLILVNGMRIAASNANVGHSDLENNWVPMESIERIEIVRGPLSALYGSEAMGGVINIITKKASNEWHGSIQTRAGFRTDGNDGETQTLGGHISGPLVAEKLSMDVSIEYANEEPTPDKANSVLTEIEGKEVATAALGFTFTPSEDHTFHLFFNGTNEERELVYSTMGTAYDDQYELKKYQVGFNVKSRIGGTDNSLKAYRAFLEKDSHKIKLSTGSVSTSQDEVVDTVVDAQSNFRFLGSRVVLGGELRREELDAGTMDQADDALHSAAFIQDEMVLFDRFSLTTGLRWDHHEIFGSELSPRVYGLYKLTDAINLKAGYGHGFNAPTLKQMDKDYHVIMGGWMHLLGNPDLEPEVSDNFEVGAEIYTDRIQAKCFYFYNLVDDLISSETVYFNPSPMERHVKYMNVDEAVTQGIETEITLLLPWSLKFSGNYTYLDARDKDTDGRLEGKPRHKLAGRLGYNYRPWGFWASLRLDYTGEMKMDDETTSDYSLWYLSMGKKITDALEIKWGVDNIFDLRLSEKSGPHSVEERGQTIWAGLSARF